MPIGDLLAQISGDKSQSTSPAPSRPPVAAVAKRKADDDLCNSVSIKTPRTSNSGPVGSSSISRPASAPRPVRPVDKAVSSTTTITGYRGSSARNSDRSSSAPKSTGNGNTVAKPGSSGTRPVNGSSAPRATSTFSSRTSTSAATVPTKEGPPKKGSFAEILARAQKAQAAMGQVGKIQHKPVEKVLTKKEREELKKDIKKDGRGATARGTAAKQPTKFQGTARPSFGGPQRNGPPMNASASASRNGSARDPRAAAKARAAEEEQEKKMKKAAVATTGYTGTARPRPGASSTKKKPGPGGALLNSRPAPRYNGSAKRSRYEEEEDEDLDDFIEYDDEEDDGVRPRYEYDSDGSSDMEAGMDDVWEEEKRAERAARKEDLQEELLEKRLKAEKEERKRRFYNEQQHRGRR